MDQITSIGEKQVFMRFLQSPLLHILVIVITVFFLYSNNFHHEYHLDSSHLIPDNPSVRSLKNIPSFFTDSSTLPTVLSNIDYRPMLQVTYALNYRISGYATWSWHLVQILLHTICAVGLYLFILKLTGQFALHRGKMVWLSLVIAMVFTLHPSAGGVVNCLSARSSLLVAALMIRISNEVFRKKNGKTLSDFAA